MKVSVLGMFTAFAVVLSYIESLIPVVGIPGVKIGLANLAIILVLYFFSIKEAIAVSIVRIFIVGVMFGNGFSIIYSIAGALFSLIAMSLLKKSDKFHMQAISVTGGVFHNVGQLLVAMVVVETYNVVYYLPVLMISGIVTGIAVGIVADMIYKRTEKVLNDI